jgi:UDP-glucose 4-epimerase
VRAVVTGGAGFIGSNLVDGLVEHGADVLVVDNLTTGRRDNLRRALLGGAELREVDVRDGARLRRAVAEHRPEVVFHLAAQIDVRRSVADAAFDAAVNLGGTINVLDAAREAGVRRVVFSSTGGAIYGEADVHPTPEEAPIRPLSPYGQSKHAGEAYCALYARLHGLESTILRYANVYGPRQDPLGEGGVVAIFCQRLQEGRRPTVFGDGTQTRDYTYVDDVVAANLRASEAAATGVFNVGARRGDERARAGRRAARAGAGTVVCARLRARARRRGAAERARPVGGARGARLARRGRDRGGTSAHAPLGGALELSTGRAPRRGGKGRLRSEAGRPAGAPKRRERRRLRSAPTASRARAAGVEGGLRRASSGRAPGANLPA